MAADLVSNNDDLAYINFKLGCKSIQGELDSIYSGKKRQIEMCFDRLIDNVPNEIIHASIRECLKDYFDSLKSDKFKVLDHKSDEIVEQSVCDSTISVASSEKAPSNLTTLEDELVGGNIKEFKNLTSTVKKVNGGKLKSLKEKIDEQSIIQEVDDETPTKEPKKKTNQENTKSSKADNYCLKIIYFLRDYTQMTASIDEFLKTDEKEIHENCLDDYRLILKAKNSNRYK